MQTMGPRTGKVRAPGWRISYSRRRQPQPLAFGAAGSSGPGQIAVQNGRRKFKKF